MTENVSGVESKLNEVLVKLDVVVSLLSDIYMVLLEDDQGVDNKFESAFGGFKRPGGLKFG